MLRHWMIVVWTACSVCAFGSETQPSTESAIDKYLPQPGFAEVWQSDGIRTFDRKTVYEYIDGEAELYYPYGFQLVATTTYTYQGDSEHAVVADVYRMGSPLDAFGIYSNYRYLEAEFLEIGAEGFTNEYQLMFYQDKYFVKLSAYGEPEQNKREMLECARAMSAKLPIQGAPVGVNFISMLGDFIPRSEKYIANSLLGYDFFPKGGEARATLDGEEIRLFTVMAESGDMATQILDTYSKYLEDSGGEPRWVKVDSHHYTGNYLTGIDPLHKKIILFRYGSTLFGAAGLKDVSDPKIACAIDFTASRVGLMEIMEMRKMLESGEIQLPQ